MVKGLNISVWPKTHIFGNVVFLIFFCGARWCVVHFIYHRILNQPNILHPSYFPRSSHYLHIPITTCESTLHCHQPLTCLTCLDRLFISMLMDILSPSGPRLSLKLLWDDSIQSLTCMDDNIIGPSKLWFTQHTGPIWHPI